MLYVQVERYLTENRAAAYVVTCVSDDVAVKRNGRLEG